MRAGTSRLAWALEIGGGRGDLKLWAGSTTADADIHTPFSPVNALGGGIKISSGHLQQTSSGKISILTADVGVAGISGYFRVKIGEATLGTAGDIGELAQN